MADFPRHTEWNHQPQQMIALTVGPVRVGSRYKTMEAPASNMSPEELEMMMEMWPKMMEAHDFEGHTVAEVTALEPNERIAWTAHLPNRQGKKLMQMHWELELQGGNGTTRVIQRCEIDPPADNPLCRNGGRRANEEE